VDEGHRRLARQVVALLSAPDVWIIDDTGFPTAGTHAAGVTRPYGGTLGQLANCQVALRVHGSHADASCPHNWRLSVPTAWIEDQPRAAHVNVPPGPRYRGKTPLALDLIDQVRTWAVPVLPVVADALYGNDCGFRHSLRQRLLPSVVEVEASTGVWPDNPPVPWPPPNKTRSPRP
jgi:SRSO17 transposase